MGAGPSRRAMILLSTVRRDAGLSGHLAGPGHSIRATGDNAAMVRASSINPAFTITCGLVRFRRIVALSGGTRWRSIRRACDINVGTGMVTIALASLIIGETLLGKRRHAAASSAWCSATACTALSWLWRCASMYPPPPWKLVSAIIVAIAISMPHQGKIALSSASMPAAAA